MRGAGVDGLGTRVRQGILTDLRRTDRKYRKTQVMRQPQEHSLAVQKQQSAFNKFKGHRLSDKYLANPLVRDPFKKVCTYLSRTNAQRPT